MSILKSLNINKLQNIIKYHKISKFINFLSMELLLRIFYDATYRHGGNHEKI